MSKRKILLASTLLVASIVATGCGGGGGGGSSSVSNGGTAGGQSPVDPGVNSEKFLPKGTNQVSSATYVYNTKTDVRFDGKKYSEVKYDATSNTPPPVPNIIN